MKLCLVHPTILSLWPTDSLAVVHRLGSTWLNCSGDLRSATRDRTCVVFTCKVDT